MSKLPKLNLRHNLPLLISLVVVTAAIPLTVFVALTQNMENRGRASEPTPPSYALTQLPIVEFGNIFASMEGPVVDQKTGTAPTVTPSTDSGTPAVAVIQYWLETKDRRIYSLTSSYNYPPCDGFHCPKMPIHQINFDQYSGKTVMIEGILKPSDTPQLGFIWSQPYPLPHSGQLLVNNIHPAQLTQSGIILERYLNSPYSGFYNFENVYYLDTNPINIITTPTPTPCPYGLVCASTSLPLVKPDAFITSPYYALNIYLGTKVKVAGDLYLVDGVDKFLNAVGPITALTTPTPPPNCRPRPGCLDSIPRCLPVEPIGGWCPITPTPTPTPSSCNGIFGINVCPMWAPPPSDWCNNGQIIPGKTDSCGCQTPPTCITPTPTVTPAAKVTLSFDPSSLNVSGNSPFTSTLTTNTNNNKVAAIDISFNFDPLVVKLVSLLPTSYMPRVLSGANIDNANGHAHIALGVDPKLPVLGNNVPVLILNGMSQKTGKTIVINVTPESRISVVGSMNNFLSGTALLSVTVKNSIPGDLDNNGVVDIFDYSLMIGNFGKTNCGNPADIDGNCVVDIFDYSRLIGNFGKSTPTLSPTPNPPVTLLRACPEEWYINLMPSIVGSNDIREYFVYKGLRRELSEFDVNWVKNNCSVKPVETH